MTRIKRSAWLTLVSILLPLRLFGQDTSSAVLFVGKDTVHVAVKVRRAVVPVVHDTVRIPAPPPVVIPLPPPPGLPVPAVTGVRGIPFGAWIYKNTLPDFAASPYSGVVMPGLPGTMLRDLDKARAAKASVVLNLPRDNIDTVLKTDPVVSTAIARRYFASWPNLTGYIADGTVWGINVADDIGAPPYSNRHAQIDSLCLLAKEQMPTVRVSVRATPTQLAAYQYKCVDYAWAQWAAYDRLGPLVPYRDTEMAKAKAQGLCLAFGLNEVNGGDGSSKKPGSRPGLWKMSGAEIVKNWTALLPYTPIAFQWDARLDTDPEVQAAHAKVRAMADTMPRKSCKR